MESDQPRSLILSEIGKPGDLNSIQGTSDSYGWRHFKSFCTWTTSNLDAVPVVDNASIEVSERLFNSIRKNLFSAAPITHDL